MVFRRLVPDAVNRAATTLDDAAGKSINVAKALRVLGQRPVVTGFLGGERSQHLRRLLEDKGIEHRFVNVTAPTRQCVTVIDEGAGTQTELVEESQPVSAADYERLMAVVRRRVGACRALVMSGTITPGGPVGLYLECARMADQAGAMPVVDAHGPPLLESLKARPALVKPNRSELAATVGRKLRDEAAVRAAMRELTELGARRVVVTAGAEPVLAFDRHDYWRIQGPRISVVNQIGAGDAFTAGLVWRLLRGEDLGEACRWAAATGAADALTLLAGEVRREDVERLAGQVRVEKL
jgi:tagatose 6-phosphate kinase